MSCRLSGGGVLNDGARLRIPTATCCACSAGDTFSIYQVSQGESLVPRLRRVIAGGGMDSCAKATRKHASVDSHGTTNSPGEYRVPAAGIVCTSNNDKGHVGMETVLRTIWPSTVSSGLT